MLKEKYAALSRREQHILLFALPIGIVLVLWLLLIRPTLAHHSALQSKLAQKTEDLAWLQQAAAQIEAPSGPSSTNEQPLRQRVTLSFAQHSINLSRIQSGNNEEISVWSDNASFNGILSAIQSGIEQNIQISQAQISTAEQSGRVNARLSFIEAANTP